MKLRYGELEATIADGLAQTWAYADTSGAGEGPPGDLRPHAGGKPWAEKIWQRVEVYRGYVITVWGVLAPLDLCRDPGQRVSSR